MSTQPGQALSKPHLSAVRPSFVHRLSDASALIDNRGWVIETNDAMQQALGLDWLNSTRSHSITHLLPGIASLPDFPLFPGDNEGRTLDPGPEHPQRQLFFQPFISIDTHLLILNHPVSGEADERLLRLVLESIPARVFWKDLQGRFLGSNSLFAADAGCQSPDELIGRTDHDRFIKDEADLFVADDMEVMRTGHAKLNIEEQQTSAEGIETWISTNKVPIRNRTGDIIGILGSYTDITERVRHQKRVEHQARFDQLTNLPNRLALQEQIDAFSNAETVGRGGLLFIDLDYFKTINDSLGHAIGDQLLIQVADRIAAAVNHRGFVARLGGDEFSVFAIGENQECAISTTTLMKNIAQDVREQVSSVFKVGLHTIRVGVSIGVTEFDHATVNWADKFNEADIAMYEAKAAGRNQVMRFDCDMRNKLQRLHSVKRELMTACDNNELFVLVQPQNDKDGQWLGGECLLRWNSKALGSVSPGEFIQVAEQSGAIHQMGLYVFEQAFRLVHELSAQHGRSRIMPLAVNVSARQFQRDGFVKNVSSLLAKTGVAAELIQFELTESLLLENPEDALVKLEELSDMGFTLAIDDFGTGYSSLSYISKLPIDKLKIDQSFTQQLGNCRRQTAVVETIILMAQNLEMSVIAEGVENQQQLEKLLELGCYEFQGYHFHRPLPMSDFRNWVENTCLK